MSFILNYGCPMLAMLLQTGLLVVAHGANPAWNDKVAQTVAQVRWDGPVETAFLMGPEAKAKGWNAAVERLTASGVKRIVVVPLMVSSAGGHFHQVRFYAGEIAAMPGELASHDHGDHVTPRVPMVVTSALDGAPEVGQALGDIWDALPETARKQPLVLVAHGPSTDAEAKIWVDDLSRAVQPIADRGKIPFAIGLLRDDAAPPVRAAAIASMRSTIEAFAAKGADSVTVFPILISTGTIGTVTIPKDLAGLPIRYRPAALAPSPYLSRWIERTALARLDAIR